MEIDVYKKSDNVHSFEKTVLWQREFM